MSRTKNTGKLTAQAIYAVASQFMTKENAARIAGYTQKSATAQHINVKPYAYEIAEIRQRLSMIPGFVSYFDQIADLHEIRVEARLDGDRASRIAADKEINKMQGYPAPLKMEIEGRQRVTVAVMEFKQLVGESGIDPLTVRRELDYRKRIKEGNNTPQQKEVGDEQSEQPEGIKESGAAWDREGEGVRVGNVGREVASGVSV
jgi:hypothetical protein